MKEISSEEMDLARIHLLRRRQIGEAAWAECVTEARRRESLLLAVRSRLDAGSNFTKAVEELGSEVKQSTLRRWMERWEAHGVAGLISLNGQLPHGHPDPVLKPRKRLSTRPRSFIKWAGSKTSALEYILPTFPKSYRRYFEPMVGSGIVFFALEPKRAVLGDVNPEIVCAFEILRDRPDELRDALARHVNTSEHFLAVRAQDPGSLSPVESAARFIYLNKTCFNGMYRVNRKGRFNVPYGRIPHANICDDWAISSTSRKLEGVTLRCGSYRDTLRDAGDGDLVYLDPPYLVPSASKGRSHLYQPEAFDEAAHRELAAHVRELTERGCHVVASNADLPEVRDLYQGFEIRSVEVRRPINRNARGRDGHRELVIVGKPGDRRRASSRREPVSEPLAEEALVTSGQVPLPLQSRRRR